MKKLLLIVFMILNINAFSQTDSTEENSAESVGLTPEGIFLFLDKTKIKTEFEYGKEYKIWVEGYILTDLVGIQNKLATNYHDVRLKNTYSCKILMHVICGKDKIKVSKAVYYGEDDSVVANFDIPNPKYNEVTPGTSGENVYNLVCDYINSKK
jgi:hypothetical protein